MDYQLNDLVKLLDQYQIAHWADSGTLLGLVRDGRLLDHDRDIDISIWEEELDKLLSLLASFKNLRYEVDVRSFHGLIHGLKLYPFDLHQRQVDIKVFRKSSLDAWCPLAISDMTYTREELKALVKRGWRNIHHVTERIFWMGLRKASHVIGLQIRQRTGIRHIDIGKNPWLKGKSLRMWLFPANLIGSPIFEKSIGVYIPESTDKYLRFRYGDWRVPVRDWIYSRDDGAASQQLLVEFLMERNLIP